MEAAGLVLGVAGVTGLFSTCMECFDVIVAGRNFSDDYEQLCALFSLQRARFGLWGESVGLIPDPASGRRLQYEKTLDRPDIKLGLERILNNIKSILEDAGQMDQRYGLVIEQSHDLKIHRARGIDVFKPSFERFKARIRSHQKKTSTWNVTRWAIHDSKRFEDMIDRLEKFVDGLESITKSLGLLAEQHARLQEEIESIADVKDLKLLHDASSSHRSSHLSILTSSSRHFTRQVAESILESQTLASSSSVGSGGTSFRTAPSRFLPYTPASISDPMCQEEDSIIRDLSSMSLSYSRHQSSLDMQIPGSWPRDAKQHEIKPEIPIAQRMRRKVKPMLPCEQCREEHYKCDAGAVPNQNVKSCDRCWTLQRECSFQINQQQNRHVQEVSRPPILQSETVTDGSSISQNQRILTGVIKGSDIRRPLSFSSGDRNYGSQLAPFKRHDEEYWINNSTKLITNASNGSSAAKRMFFELRKIKSGKVPFVSATAIDDRLDKVLASIEGPPDTPYEGGVFWIAVTIPESEPKGLPMMKFHTRVYHPNISPQGHICADYREKWESVLSYGTPPVHDPSDVWFSAKSTEIRWTLGALLTAVCGLLASPDVDDPLVPEIAQKYVEDYEGYCEAARLYTQRYAKHPRPDISNIIFPEEKKDIETPDYLSQSDSSLFQEQKSDTISTQESLDERYDDKDLFGRPRSSTFNELDPSIDQEALFDNTHRGSALINYLIKPVMFERTCEMLSTKNNSRLISEVIQVIILEGPKGFHFSNIEVIYGMLRLNYYVWDSLLLAYGLQRSDFVHSMANICATLLREELLLDCRPVSFNFEMKPGGYFVVSVDLGNGFCLHSILWRDELVTWLQQRSKSYSLTIQGKLSETSGPSGWAQVAAKLDELQDYPVEQAACLQEFFSGPILIDFHEKWATDFWTFFIFMSVSSPRYRVDIMSKIPKDMPTRNIENSKIYANTI